MAGGFFGWLDTLGLWWSSLFSGDRKKILSNPAVMGEILQREVDGMVRDFSGHQDAVADLMAIVISDEKQRDRLLKEKAGYEEENEGAVAAAQERAAALQAAGNTPEQVQADPQFMEAQAVYQDNASTIEEKQRRIDDLNGRITANRAKVTEHKIILQKIQREIEAKKAAAKDTVAQAYANQALIGVNQRLSNMTERKEDKDAQEVRELADSLAAKAQITGELAGNNAAVAGEKFKAKARERKANDAFASLVGLAAKKDAAPAAPVAAEKEAAAKLP